jgi:putative nucleotidyltransferase with HDIG domain
MNQPLLKGYIGIIFVISFFASGYFLADGNINWLLLLPLAVLTLVAEFYKVQVFMQNSEEQVSVSWSSVLSIGALLSLGVNEAIIISILSGMISSLYPRKLPLIKILYNIASYSMTVIATNSLMILFDVLNLIEEHQVIIVPFTIAFIYIISNYFLATILMKIITQKSFTEIVTDLIFPHLPHSLIFAFIGSILGIWYGQYGVIALLSILTLIGIINYGMKTSTKAANDRIQELADSNEQIKQLAVQLDQTFDDFIETLTATVDARDPYTYGHSLQVSHYAYALATELGMDEKEIERIRIAGLLHDIGKISIPEHILFKNGRLTDEEYEVVKQHAPIGEEIIGQIPSLADIASLIGMHHERYNGRGYPRGLKEQEISLGAHILGVSDTLDTILSSRSYKKGRTVEEAMQEFERCRGNLFHPDVVDALFRLRKALGDGAFKNSAMLVDKADIVGKVKSHKKITQILSKGAANAK